VTVVEAVIAYLSDPSTYEGRFALQTLIVQHVWYVLVATAIASAIAIPVGLWVGHRGRGELGVVAVANTGRAVPDFGIILMAFLVLGLRPSVVIIALVALAIPPILVNTYVGVRQVDRDAVDAARGAGMTGRQVLREVELPLAAPLIMTGLRTSAVQVVATATLGGYVGLGGLGRLIFDGFAFGVTRGARTGLPLVVVGSLLVAIMAILTEVGLARVEKAVTPQGIRRDGPVVGETPDVDEPVLTARTQT
jgi:osmoprotectant transport system permease protein